MTKPISDQNDTTADYPNAGVFPRLIAMIYDGLLIFALLCLATLIAMIVTGHLDTSIPEASNKVMYKAQPIFEGFWYQVYLVAVVVAFYSIFWRQKGQTLGMQAWRIKVQQTNGDIPSWGQCIVRCLTAILSMLPAFLGYFWIWLDKDNCAWHDRLSGTRVVRLPKQKKS